MLDRCRARGCQQGCCRASSSPTIATWAPASSTAASRHHPARSPALFVGWWRDTANKERLVLEGSFSSKRVNRSETASLRQAHLPGTPRRRNRGCAARRWRSLPLRPPARLDPSRCRGVSSTGHGCVFRVCRTRDHPEQGRPVTSAAAPRVGGLAVSYEARCYESTRAHGAGTSAPAPGHLSLVRGGAMPPFPQVMAILSYTPLV